MIDLVSLTTKINNKIKRILSKDTVYAKVSYSQQGEDLIVNFIFSEGFKISKPTYLDIGAHHPFFLSNTFFFYKKGCRGVLVEPDPILVKQLKQYRQDDICLNVGVSDKNMTSDFYIMQSRSLNTFSKEKAEALSRDTSFNCPKIDNIVKVSMLNINTIIEKYFSNIPNFISIDAEGLDLEILSSLDFSRYSPEIFCIECVGVAGVDSIKDKEIID
ncbi:MAG: FkbM family methyltransferase [Candidatus Omnitrophica bacterium]|nr:FkbM family methyltransferase [Candidatus Omnitrophota bacterium]